MTDIKTIPFFFRRINDLEQLLPIVEYFLKKKNKILLICLNEEFKIDYYKKFQRFRNSKKIEVDHFYNFLTKKKFFFNLILKLSISNNNFFFLKSWIMEKIYNEKNIIKFLKDYDFNSAIFDFPISNKEYLSYIEIFKKYNIKIFGIHHAIWVRDVNIKKNKIKKLFLKFKKDTMSYDKILVFNDEFKKALESLGCKNKLIFFGILNKKKNFLKKKLLKKNKINILYLDHSQKHGVNKLMVVKDLKVLRSNPKIKITIRPNTAIEFANKSELDIYYQNKLGSYISYEDTIKLIKKNDIIINPISSVIIKAYLLNKIILHPKHYIPNEQMLWQRYRSCYEVKSTSEVIDIIDSLSSKKLNTKTYFKNCNKMLDFLIRDKNLDRKLKNIYRNII